MNDNDNKKRILLSLSAIAAAILLIVSTALLVSCDGGAESSGDETTTAEIPAETTLPEEEAEELIVIKGGETEFKIVRTEGEDYREETAATAFAEKLKTVAGCDMPLTYDWYVKVEPAAQYEILVGHTSREESTAANAELDALDGYYYTLRCVGDRIVATGNSGAMVERALDHLIDNYLAEDGSIVVPKELNFTSDAQTPGVADYFDGDTENLTLRSELVGTITPSDGCKIIQGGATDGKYLYVIVNDGASSGAKSVLKKIDIKTMEVTASKSGLEVDHGNDVVYKKSTSELIIVHNAPNRDTLTVLDAETLEFKQTVKLPMNIYALSYDEYLDCYWVGVSGGDNFAKLTADFQFVKTYRSKQHTYVTQGMTSDDKYLYFIRYKKNCVIVYDKKGGYVGEFDVSFSGEPENISIVGDEFYIVGNNSAWNGGNIYRVIVRK